MKNVQTTGTQWELVVSRHAEVAYSRYTWERRQSTMQPTQGKGRARMTRQGAQEPDYRLHGHGLDIPVELKEHCGHTGAWGMQRIDRQHRALERALARGTTPQVLLRWVPPREGFQCWVWVLPWSRLRDPYVAYKTARALGDQDHPASLAIDQLDRLAHGRWLVGPAEAPDWLQAVTRGR